MIRQVAMNPVTLKQNTQYQFKLSIVRERALNSSVPLKFTITPSLNLLPEYQAVIGGSDPLPITWNFNTLTVPEAQLQNVVFTLKAVEENITLGEAAPVLFSDISFFELLTGTPAPKVHRYTGGTLESTFANLASNALNGAVTLGDTTNLIEAYETASAQYRMYLLNSGDVYVWEIDNNDPFALSRLARCVISC